MNRVFSELKVGKFTNHPGEILLLGITRGWGLVEVRGKLSIQGVCSVKCYMTLKKSHIWPVGWGHLIVALGGVGIDKHRTASLSSWALLEREDLINGTHDPLEKVLSGFEMEFLMWDLGWIKLSQTCFQWYVDFPSQNIRWDRSAMVGNFMKEKEINSPFPENFKLWQIIFEMLWIQF